VEAHPIDEKAAAALLKLSRAVPGANGPKIREKRSHFRPGSKNRFDFKAEAHKGELARFLSLVAYDLVRPVDVLGVKKGDVRLRSAGKPSELVEGAPLGVFLGGDDHAVLVLRDRPLFFKRKSRPHAPGNNGARKPVHSNRKIVDAPKVNVRRNFSLLHRAKEVLGAGLKNRKRPDEGKRLVLCRDKPAASRLPFLQLHNLVHHILPRACRGARVSSHEIRARDLNVDDRLAVRLVFHVEEPLCFGAIPCAKALLLSCLAVLAPVNSSAKEHAVFLSYAHNAFVTSLRKPGAERYGAVGMLALAEHCSQVSAIC